MPAFPPTQPPARVAVAVTVVVDAAAVEAESVVTVASAASVANPSGIAHWQEPDGNFPPGSLHFSGAGIGGFALLSVFYTSMTIAFNYSKTN